MRNVIIVGVDGSDCSKKALRWAAALAKPFDADLEAVIYWQMPPIVAGFGGAYLPETVDPSKDAEKALTETVDEVFGTDRPHMDLVVQEGDAARGLIKRSADARMLVVGSRGHGGFASLLLGSVSAKCVEHGSCPVLVIHGDTPAPEIA